MLHWVDDERGGFVEFFLSHNADINAKNNV